MAFADSYSPRMSSEKIRRISTFLAAVVLAAGLFVHDIGGPDMIVMSAMTIASDVPMSSDMPMLGKCKGCAGDEKGVAQAACCAFCGAVIAAPLMDVVLDAVLAETLSPTTGPEVVGRADPPEPYPPRTIILS
jgi:hypothetical protein